MKFTIGTINARTVQPAKDRQTNPRRAAVMETPIYIALSRQMALRQEMELVANNIANASTAGFKAELMVMTEVDLPAEPGTKLAYVQDMASARDFSQGALRPTESPLDLAIDGKGFFAVRTPEGIRYTRVGRFQLDDNGVLVTSQGYPVLGGGSPLTLTPEDGPINVAADGTISTDRALEGQQLAIVGKLDLVDFADPARLTPAVDGFFVASQPARPAEGGIIQGMLEDSNVKPIVEMTNLIEVTRTYQSVQRFLDAEHERQRRAIGSISSNT
jgi:flagellar basal-body rod protein FlgF